MSEEIKRYFEGRIGAWVGLVLYVIMDACLVFSAWLESAPDDLSTVSSKKWLTISILLVAGSIKQIRSYINNSWGGGREETPTRKIYGQPPAPPTPPTAQKGDS